jgi:hypothetical protein
MATFVLEDMTEKQFQRSVVGQSSEHRIDGQVKFLVFFVIIENYLNIGLHILHSIPKFLLGMFNCQIFPIVTVLYGKFVRAKNQVEKFGGFVQHDVVLTVHVPLI